MQSRSSQTLLDKCFKFENESKSWINNLKLAVQIRKQFDLIIELQFFVVISGNVVYNLYRITFFDYSKYKTIVCTFQPKLRQKFISLRTRQISQRTIIRLFSNILIESAFHSWFLKYIISTLLEEHYCCISKAQRFGARDNETFYYCDLFCCKCYSFSCSFKQSQRILCSYLWSLVLI